MRYRAFRDSALGTCLLDETSELDQRKKGLLSQSAELLWEFEAATWEEASAIHHLRMGFEPYAPAGSWEPCPKCGAAYYPLGSGQCWRCGKVS